MLDVTGGTRVVVYFYLTMLDVTGGTRVVVYPPRPSLCSIHRN